MIAVEPQPIIVDLLTENLKQFAGRAQVARVAISDAVGESFFEIDQVNRGASKLVDKPTSESITVQTWSGEQLIEFFQPERVDIIKIDVEGHEEKVFRSIDKMIGRYRPRLIVFENQSDKAAPTESIGKILSHWNYSIYGVKKNLTNLRFPEILKKSDCVYNDYIAVLNQDKLSAYT